MRHAMRALYVFRSPDASVILDKMIIPQVEKGIHGAEIVGMFFFFDNTLLFVPDNPIGAKLVRLSKQHHFFLLCCDLCTEASGIASRLYEDAEEGCFPDLCKKAEEMGAQLVVTL